MSIVIPVSTRYDNSGFTALEHDAKRAEREAIASTRRQIAEHRKAVQLTAKLDKDLASERAKARDQLKTGATAVLGAGTILAGAGMQAVAAAKESIAAEMELQAALNSTGQAAAGYKAELAALANELQNTSMFSDEAVMHAQSLLVSFGKIGRDVMPAATQAVADMAQLMGGDLAGAAKLVGKVLAEPENAAARLTKAGILLTQSQKNQIEAFAETGDAAGAQGVILEALNQKYGGQAQAARDAAGGTQDLIVASGELQESMGKLMLAIGDSGIGGGLATMIGWLDDGAKAWTNFFGQTEIAGRALDIMAEKNKVAAGSTREFLENIPLFGGLVKAGEFVGALVTREDELSSAMVQAGQEHAASAAAADKNATALAAEGDAAEDDAKSMEELERALKAAGAARRDMAGSMIDITEKAAADTAKVNADFAKDDAKLLADHAEANVKISADSEKERLANAKQLAKDLAAVDKDLAKDLEKVDKDLAKDKAKLDKDTGKQIARMQQDAAREEKQQRRARLIDARGDERLFQFDMRQLAAEGSFNAIQEAMGRRAIEKQIEDEKLKEEQTAKQESSRVEIDRIKADAEERKREMETEAEERKAEMITAAEEKRTQLQEAAAEEEIMRQEQLAQALADEQANYDERQAALVEARDEKLAAIEEGKIAAIEKLAEELTETGDLTKSELEALTPLAGEFGEDAGKAFADGLSAGFARNNKIDQMIDSLGGSSSAGGNNPGGKATPGKKGKPVGHPGAFAGGGAFTVGGSGGTDSELVSFFASPGEKVTITPPGQAGGGNIVVNVNGPGGAELAAIIRRKVEQAVEEYHNQVIVPWAAGG